MVSAGYWGHSQSKYSLYVCSTKNNMCWGGMLLVPYKGTFETRIRNSEFVFRISKFGIRSCVFFCSKKWKGSDTKLLFVHQLQECRNRGCRGCHTVGQIRQKCKETS